MKRYIRSSYESKKMLYHGTKSLEAAKSIVANGFNTTYADFVNDLSEARAYGSYVVCANEAEVNSKLNILPINDQESQNRSDYPSNCDGIVEDRYGDGMLAYHIFNVPKLNANVDFELMK